MYVSQLWVKGFHSLEHVRITFKPGLNVIVGKNNAGKSNIIRALDYILGEKYPTYRDFEEHSFFCPGSEEDIAESITIVVSLSGGGINRDEIRQITRSAKVYPNCDGPHLGDLGAWLTHTEVNVHPSWVGYSELADNLEEAGSVLLYLFVPRDGHRSDRQFGLVYKVGERWELVPAFQGKLCNALLTTAYVPSFRDPGYQLRINKFSWYGKLIQHIYGLKSPEQSQRIKRTQDELTDLLAEVFDVATTDLRKQIQETVFHHAISFRPGVYTRDDDYKNIMLFVNDGIDAPFYEKGSGIQSALVIALFELYCRSFHQGSSLLLVEEPELYLHPHAKRVLETRLAHFVEESQQENDDYHRQVIISTHSPEFLRSVTTDRLVVVLKKSGDICTEVMQGSPLDAVREPRAAQVIKRNAEMFFADHVILVEGGEEHIIPSLADLVFAKKSSLDLMNVSVARVDGKGQFGLYSGILDKFGIGWTILADLDFLKDFTKHFPDALDDEGGSALSKIRAEWNTIKELPRKSREFRDGIFDKEVHDWRDFYYAVDEVVKDLKEDETPSEERLVEMENLWDRLSARVYKANYERLWEQCPDELRVVLHQLRHRGIFVLSKGDLEAYMTDALQLSGSKDRRAYRLGLELANLSTLEEAEKWLTCNDFVEMLEHVADKVDSEALIEKEDLDEDTPF